MTAQLSLNLENSLRYSSASFVGHEGVESVVDTVLALAENKIFSSVYIRGEKWSGKTHLGVYLVGQMHTSGKSARLLSAVELPDWCATQLPLEPLLPGELVVLDDADLHLESAQLSKQAGIFIDLSERVSAAAGTLVLLGAKSPETIRCSQQVKSRLAAGMHVHIGPPQDSALDKILDSIAKQRGLALTDAKRGFLLRRVVRTVPALVDCVNRVEGSGEGASLSTSFDVLSEAISR